MPDLNQRLQLPQLAAPQLAQELPVPAMGAVSPLSLSEKEAKTENIRSALLWQRGQEAP